MVSLESDLCFATPIKCDEIPICNVMVLATKVNGVNSFH